MFQIMLHIIFDQSQTLLSLIQYIAKYISLYNAKSMLLEPSSNIFLYYILGITTVDIFNTPNILGQNFWGMTLR
jgi:hypothetical protein